MRINQIMNVKILLLILLILLSSLLSGCSWFNSVDSVKVNTEEVQRARLNLDGPPAVELKKVEWFVITPENVDQVFKDLEEKKYNIVLIGLTDDGYENLSFNMITLKNYIIKQKKIISAYKEYYESKEGK